jgi:hypothetical protein
MTEGGDGGFRGGILGHSYFRFSEFNVCDINCQGGEAADGDSREYDNNYDGTTSLRRRSKFEWNT